MDIEYKGFTIKIYDIGEQSKQYEVITKDGLNSICGFSDKDVTDLIYELKLDIDDYYNKMSDKLR